MIMDTQEANKLMVEAARITSYEKVAFIFNTLNFLASVFLQHTCKKCNDYGISVIQRFI